MFNKIVVGIDGSEAAEAALRLACDLAQKYDSELHLVHTPQRHPVAFPVGAVAGYHDLTTMPSSSEAQAAAEIVVKSGKKIVQELGRTIKQTYTQVGNPADELVACAEGCAADLIITGRRGLGNVGSLLQGSTSLRVNHLAKCACLSVA